MHEVKFGLGQATCQTRPVALLTAWYDFELGDDVAQHVDYGYLSPELEESCFIEEEETEVDEGFEEVVQ